MLIIALDTNILISAFLTPYGESDEVLRRAKGEMLCLSPFIFTELVFHLRSDRLRNKYRYTIADLKKYTKSLYKVSRIISPIQAPQICSDEDDNNVLACAIEAQAEYLVTRNTKHFPQSFGGVTVITPKEFLSIVKSL